MEYRETKQPARETKAESVKAPIYPSLHLPLEIIPEAENWKIGETYEIALRVKQQSITRSEKDGGVKGGYVDFDITGIRILSGKSEEKRVEENSQGSYKERE